MTSQELKHLEDYLLRLTHVGYVERDPQAAEAIAVAFSRQIDAPYLAVQRCLQLEQALSAAKARIAQLESLNSAALNAAYSTSSALRPQAAAVTL